MVLLMSNSSLRGTRGQENCVRGRGGDGNNVAGTGGDGDSWEKKHAGMGGDGVSVDFAGREWGQISVPMQLSSLEIPD